MLSDWGSGFFVGGYECLFLMMICIRDRQTDRHRRGRGDKIKCCVGGRTVVYINRDREGKGRGIHVGGRYDNAMQKWRMKMKMKMKMMDALTDRSSTRTNEKGKDR